MSGALFETAVFSEIRKLMLPLARKAQVHHWRAHSGSEVDLLLERDGMFYPIEVKMGTQLSRNDSRGIQSLRATYPAIQMAPGLVIGPVERFERLSEIDYAAPWDMI